MKKAILFFIMIIAVWFFFFRDETIKLGPGVFAPDEPKQVKIDNPQKFQFKGYTMTPLAKFYVKAKVLSRKRYIMGREAELSPIDLALGWGRMSDEGVTDSIDVSQSRRWYRWSTKKYPIPRREIETHSSNMHIIPADKTVEKELKKVKRGQIVEFSGNLVRVDAEDGWWWASSLNRTDKGNHSCEVVWVEVFKADTIPVVLQ